MTKVISPMYVLMLLIGSDVCFYASMLQSLSCKNGSLTSVGLTWLNKGYIKIDIFIEQSLTAQAGKSK